MKYILLFLIPTLVFSCGTKNKCIESGVYRYYYKSSNEKEELILNSDSSFILNSYKTSCSGKWEYINPDIILISCDDVNFIDKLQSGYMAMRKREIKILNKNKLKFPIINNVKMKYVILKKE